jgi:glycerol 2-dehydrogenase (NADP+)
MDKTSCIGYGTFSIKDSDIIKQAIKLGYRHIDAASHYQNEEIVGKGIRDSIEEGLVKREDLYIVSKMASTQWENPEEALEQSLKSLGLDYIDLYFLLFIIFILSLFHSQIN